MTARQQEVLELVLRGLSNKEVASLLFITEQGVKWHLTNIYRNERVKNRRELTAVFK